MQADAIGRRFFSVCLALLLISSTCSAINQCGGDKPLSAAVGDLCESQLREGCPFGRIACQGANSVACIPNCDITFDQIVKNTLTCKNKGTLACQCPPGYSGRECELRDSCAGIKCGEHGVCENGSCVCDPDYMGIQCEIRRDCVGSNFVWTGTTCACAPNYEGPRCERCASTILCVPLDKNGKRYGAIHVSNTTIMEKLLSDNPPVEYSTRPRRPSPLTLCSCEINANSNTIEANFLSDDDYDMYSPDMYIHHYYGHRVDNDGDCRSYLAWTGVLVVLLVIVMLCFCVYTAATEPEQKYKEKSSSKKRSSASMDYFQHPE